MYDKKNKYKGKHIFSSYFSRISSRTPLLSRGAIMGGYIWISGYIYMGENSQGVQSLISMSFFFVFLSTYFGNLEVR